MAEETPHATDLGKEAARLAYLIVGFCAVALGLIFVANSDQLRRAQGRAAAQQWFDDVSAMLQRNRDYGARGAGFYSALLAESIRTNPCPTNEPRHCADLPAEPWQWLSKAASEDSSKSWFDTGVTIQELISSQGDDNLEQRIARLLKERLSSAAMSRITTRDVLMLIEAGKSTKWNGATGWIVYNQVPWDLGRIFQYFAPAATYGWTTPNESNLRTRNLYFRLVKEDDSAEIDRVLLLELETALGGVVKSGSIDSRVSVLGSGVQFDSGIAINAIMILTAGLVVLFSVVLGVALAEYQGSSVTATFPHFGRFSNSEAFDPTLQRLCSIVWWAFLLLPALILSVGLSARYTLVLSQEYPNRGLIMSFVPLLSGDIFSVAIDYVNLGCLASVLGAITFLETQRPTSHERRLQTWLSVIIAILLAASLFVLVKRDLSEAAPVWALVPRAMLFASWALVLLVALKRGSRDLWWVAAAICILIAIAGLPLGLGLPSM